MNKTHKIILLVLFALVMAACKKKDTRPDTDPVEDTTDNTPVVDTTTNQYRDPSSICCNPSDLDNPESLLAQRVIYFDYDQSTVLPEYRNIIEIHARYLSQNPSARITLEGHADERGSREYNLALGERRGNAVSSLMNAQGASGSQLNVVSYGEERPVALCSDDSCWSQNRRVEIVYTAR
ncbi:peptidoglycan-associated lipoprotein Pal [Marinicella sp. W31]|uniref:peptidoglycan-associated lipoprotein Pal n=1 Tax=Marinicella sp. W31 TaxID=3023713 RepID=UPI003756944F